MVKRLTQLLVPELQLRHLRDSGGRLSVSRGRAGKFHLMLLVCGVAEHVKPHSATGNAQVPPAEGWFARKAEKVHIEIRGASQLGRYGQEDHRQFLVAEVFRRGLA